MLAPIFSQEPQHRTISSVNNQPALYVLSSRSLIFPRISNISIIVRYFAILCDTGGCLGWEAEAVHDLRAVVQLAPLSTWFEIRLS